MEIVVNFWWLWLVVFVSALVYVGRIQYLRTGMISRNTGYTLIFCIITAVVMGFLFFASLTAHLIRYVVFFGLV